MLSKKSMRSARPKLRTPFAHDSSDTPSQGPNRHLIRLPNGSISCMNSTSLIFALLASGLFAALAWIIDRASARNNHWSPAKRRVARWFFYPFAAVVGIYVYFTDAGLRNTTLFEVAGPWQETGDRVWTVQVEHPGVPHELRVFPDVPAPENASAPVTLRVRFGTEGGEPLLDEVSRFEVRNRSGKAIGWTWDSKTYTITPGTSGSHLLKVSAEDHPPPRLHLRIADPGKRDGKRAPGY